MSEPKQKQPPFIGDFVVAKIGQTWTADDAEEVMRQWRRLDELAQEVISTAVRDALAKRKGFSVEWLLT